MVMGMVDLVESSVGPGLDGVEETDEEVDGEGPDVGLVLEGAASREELLFDFAAKLEHVLCVATDLAPGGPMA
jgi:hypothetical protein